jgi:hypothetical protein
MAPSPPDSELLGKSFTTSDKLNLVLLLPQGCPGFVVGGTALDSQQIANTSAFKRPSAGSLGNALVIKRGELLLEGGHA